MSTYYLVWMVFFNIEDILRMPQKFDPSSIFYLTLPSSIKLSVEDGIFLWPSQNIRTLIM